MVAALTVLLATLAAQTSAAVPALAPSKFPDGPAWSAAQTNKLRIKVRPQVKPGPKPDYPETERLALHGGTVSIVGIVDTDGRLTEPTIQSSSGFPVLDQSALTAAGLVMFTPAQDASGTIIAVPITYPVRFDPYDAPPKIVRTKDSGYPDADRAAGRHGRVVVTGVVGTDGMLTTSVVSTSSMAPGLDAVALETARATVFAVRQGKDGKPLPTPIRLAYDYDSIHSPGKGGGVLRYRCDQFARDQDWWNATWPKDKHDEFYTMMLGVRMIGQMQQLGVAAAFKGNLADFNERWTKSIEACRAKPDAMFIDIMKPEGEWARRMAGG